MLTEGCRWSEGWGYCPDRRFGEGSVRPKGFLISVLRSDPNKCTIGRLINFSTLPTQPYHPCQLDHQLRTGSKGYGARQDHCARGTRTQSQEH